MDSLRKRIRWLAVTLLAAATVPASAQLSVNANGPYYATPSWNQKLTTNRFVILTNWSSEAVLDRETGLVWERTPDVAEAKTLAGAHSRCFNLTTGGRMGWRVPQAQELLTLIEPDSSVGNSPKLPVGHPFVLPTDPNFYVTGFWSSTVILNSDPPRAHRVSFAAVTSAVVGRAPTVQSGNAQGYPWCVRGGAGALPVW